ncbi:transcriptional regulator, IclR family [Geomicrobium sp. JCM 19038]|nr:transcriptional regulator, IclR family [Geomicrobium sp. JCM 19038]
MLTGDQKKKQKAKYSVPAVDSAFRILRLLSRKKFSDSTVTEIANALELQPTTCFRILQQLKESSIVTFHEKSKRYRLGPYLVVLGERAKENSLDLALVLPYLEKISENTGLTSVIVSRVGKMKTTIVAKVEGGDFGFMFQLVVIFQSKQVPMESVYSLTCRQRNNKTFSESFMRVTRLKTSQRFNKNYQVS